MDELEISGKRYISSKRIAKENKYHSDYIGQLIRAGKIQGTKVGRAWYVEEGSFAEYLNKETGVAYTSPIPAVAEIVEKEVEPMIEPAQSFSIGSGEPRESSASASLSHVTVLATTGEPQQNPAAEPKTDAEGSAQAIKIEIRKVEPVEERIIREEVFIPEVQVPEKKAESIKKPGLTYISDSSPLFPEIAKRPKVVAPQQKIQIHKEPVRALAPVVVQQKLPAKRSALRTGLALVSLTTLAAAVLALVFFGSLDINSTVVIEKGKPASVAYSQNETLCFIFGTCQSK